MSTIAVKEDSACNLTAKALLSKGLTISSCLRGAVRSASLAAVASSASSCRRDVATSPVEASFTVVASAGNGQSAAAGSVLPIPLSVQVTDASGAPVKGSRVVFRVLRGSATGSRMIDSISVTSPAGVATAELRLGSALDTTVVAAFPASAYQRAARFTAVAVAAPFVASISPATFASGDTITVRGSGFGAVLGADGTVLFGDARARLLDGATDGLMRAVVPACLSPGLLTVRVAAGTVMSNGLATLYQARSSSLALAPYQALTIRSAQLADCVTLAGNGATYLIVAQFAGEGSATTLTDWRLGASAAAGSVATLAPALRTRDELGLQRELELFLRGAEQRIAPQARAEAAAARGISAAYLQGTVVPPPALGSARSFRVVAALDGTSFVNVGTRLKFAGDHLLIYVDTIGEGFSDQQYLALGALFDRDLYPLDIAAFGSESDVDQDGRIVALFTPQVNRLVRAQDCGQFGYVTGFFYATDLLLENPNSNRAEVFYSFIPDSTARFSCAHTAADVLRILPGTFVHELQHMISFNQHVLARSSDPEVIWLNEGLSHIAEEGASRYYEMKYPAPTGRSTTEQIFPDSSGPFIAPQLLNAYVYLNNTRGHSVTAYSGAGSVEERGASWLFLRWLGEQKGEDVFRKLVQSSSVGAANVEAQAGEPFTSLFGDFSTALFTDSLPGLSRSVVPPRFRFGTRDLRKLMAREATISGFTAPWPLPLFSLRVGGFLQSTMLPGTMTHALVQTDPGSPSVSLRFTRQDLSALAVTSAAQVTIFRLPP